MLSTGMQRSDVHRITGRTTFRWLPLLVGAVALSTACSSTAQVPGGQVAGGAPGQPEVVGQDPSVTAPGADRLTGPELSDDGLGVNNTSGGTSPSGGGGGNVSTGGRGGGSATTGGSGSSGAAGKAPAPGGAAGIPSTGRGYDEKTLLVGFGVSSGAGSSLGVKVSTGSQEKQAEAVVADINARGGILGRKIKLVVHEMSTEEWNNSRSGAQQAACATWTQDHQVFAAISASGNFQYGNSSLYECLAKKSTPFIFADNLPREQKLYDRYPSTLYTPGTATVDRYGPGLIWSLNEQKYFTGWDHRTGAPGALPVKVGVLYSSDEPGLPAVYKPALAGVGQRDPLFYELNAKTTQDYSAAVSNAVLRFRAENVTHVLTNGSLTFFGPAANSQGYKPRLGVTTWDALTVAVQVTPRDSLRGALGAGYLPHIDVEQGNAPKDVSPVETRCRKIMEKAGQPASSRQTVYSMLTICEDFWLIETALKRGGALTTEAMRAGVESQTQPVVAGLTFAMRYGPRQHDGAHAVRNLAYVDGGFRYTSGNRPLG